jgi:prepilin signal peptidase PulO-like enzyme (type II secretory pathway)
MLLPDRLTFPLISIAGVSVIVQFIVGRPLHDIWTIFGGVVVAAGVFWVLYQVSAGNWVGGGDIKLGILAGLVLGSPMLAFLYLFLASVLGLLYSLPLMLTKRLTRASKVPFGPFLIASLVIVMLWGSKVIDWYSQTILGI